MDPQDSPPAPAMPARRRRGAWTLGVGLVAVAAGFLMVAGASTADGTDLRAERRTQLVDLVRAREAEVARQTARIGALRADVDGITSTQNPSPTSGAADTEALERAAGTVPVKGPGLTVELDDAPREPGQALPDGVQPDDLVVHQQDVQAVVNALWSGGAEAMTIMDQRVVATSAVRCVGNTLILQGRVYAPPFTISAVGDQAAMRQALDASSGVTAYRDWSDAVGLGYSVTNAPALLLPGYDGPLDLDYAKGSR